MMDTNHFQHVILAFLVLERTISQKDLEETEGEMSMEEVRDNAYFYFEENFEEYYEMGLGVDKFIKEKQ